MSKERLSMASVCSLCSSPHSANIHAQAHKSLHLHTAQNGFRSNKKLFMQPTVILIESDAFWEPDKSSKIKSAEF